MLNGLILGMLLVASLIGFVLKWRVGFSTPHGVIDNLNARIKAWWVMAIVMGGSLAIGHGAVILLFLGISFFALREFLTLASQAQMSVPPDRAVIRLTFEWLAANPEALALTWKCSINLAGATMSDDTIAGFIREQRANNAIPAAKVVFEITESEAIRNPAAASRLVDDLKAQGFGIALDDFGTGLATFEYLKRFPLDYLKIDGSFVRNLMTNPIDEEIILSTVRVAKRLKLRTIAEHVHNAAIYPPDLICGISGGICAARYSASVRSSVSGQSGFSEKKRKSP